MLLAFQQFGCDLVLQTSLDHSFQWSRTIGGVVPLIADRVDCGIRYVQSIVVLFQLFLKSCNLQRDDLSNLLFLERFKENRFIDSIEKLGQESCSERFLDSRHHLLFIATFLCDPLNDLASYVAGHYHNCICKIDRSILAVG